MHACAVAMGAMAGGGWARDQHAGATSCAPSQCVDMQMYHGPRRVLFVEYLRPHGVPVSMRCMLHMHHCSLHVGMRAGAAHSSSPESAAAVRGCRHMCLRVLCGLRLCDVELFVGQGGKATCSRVNRLRCGWELDDMAAAE